MKLLDNYIKLIDFEEKNKNITLEIGSQNRESECYKFFISDSSSLPLLDQSAIDLTPESERR